jgi:hypothetical protein
MDFTLSHKTGEEIPYNHRNRISKQLHDDWGSKIKSYNPDVHVKIENNPHGIVAVYLSLDSKQFNVGYLERTRINTGLPSDLEKLMETEARTLTALTAEGTHANYSQDGDTDVYVHWGLLEEFRGEYMPNSDTKMSDAVLRHIVNEVRTDRSGLLTYSPADKEPYKRPSYATRSHMKFGAVPGLIIPGGRPGYPLPDVCINFYRWPHAIEPLFKDSFKLAMR